MHQQVLQVTMGLIRLRGGINWLSLFGAIDLDTSPGSFWRKLYATIPLVYGVRVSIIVVNRVVNI